MSFFFFSTKFSLFSFYYSKQFWYLGGEFVEKYAINNKTIALYSMNTKTRVYEEKYNFVVNQTSREIMEESCAYFGSSLDGRKKGTKALLGSTYKPPIIVSESNNLIFFPTSSPKGKNCSWLRLDRVKSYYYRNNHLVVEFKNGDKILLNVSYELLNNQVLKSSRLQTILSERKFLEKAKKSTNTG